jgi:UDP-glucose 4-epimerase
MKKVVVTGGFGFIGSRMVRHLRSKGLEVLVMEHPNALVPSGLEDVPVLRADITSEESLNSIRLSGVEAVLHLAGQASGERSFYEPVLDVRLNVLGTLNIINWCLANKIDRLLFASSFNVYGDHPESEIYHEGMECHPKSVYATSKLTCEYLLRNYAQPKGIRWNVLRMFNVYGPGQNITRSDQGVVGIFMYMLLKSDEVQIKGRLDRFRDLIYIDDVIQGWERVLFSQAYNQVFNLGTGIRTTFDDLIHATAEVMGKSDRLVIRQLEGTPGDMQGSVADISRIRDAVQYSPRYPLIIGLKEMWEWVRKSGRFN